MTAKAERIARHFLKMSVEDLRVFQTIMQEQGFLVSVHLVPVDKPEEGQPAAPARPEFVRDEHLEYLDELHKRNPNNYALVPFIREKFPKLSNKQAMDTLIYWMKMPE